MSLVDEVYYLEGEGTFLNSVQTTLKECVSLEPSIESAIISGNSINVNHLSSLLSFLLLDKLIDLFTF